MMTRLGLSVFCSALQGAAMAITEKREARELIERAKWLADEAEQMAVRERDSSEPTDLDGEPFPLVRQVSGPPAPPRVCDSSVMFRGSAVLFEDEAAHG